MRDIIKGYGKDIGIDFEVAYLDESTMPKDSKGSTGSSYIVDEKNRKVLIPIDVNKIEDIKKVLGTLTEEVAHGKDALEGRQDKKVAEDNSNKEKGLETLGRPANEYVKKKFGEDNNSKIKLTTDGIDLSNADVGEKVGDDPATATIVTLGIVTIIGTGRDVYRYYKITDRGIANGIENLKKEENKSRYRKILEEKGEKALLKEMTKEFDGAKNNISELTKLFFVIYGATDEIRNLFIEKRINSEGKAIDMLVLDIVAPEKVKTLWVMPETSENVDKVTNYWKTKLLNRDSFSLTKDNRERDLTIANPDFTRNKEFYSFGNTTLFQSTYGSVTKLENGKYDVDITVMFQYTDRFEDVKNINNSSRAKQGLNKEYEGGKIFSFETNPKIVTIKKQVDSLDEITGLLKNRLKGIDDNSELGKYNIKGVIHD